MKFKRIVPYVIAGVSLTMNSDDAAAQVVSVPAKSSNLMANVMRHIPSHDIFSTTKNTNVLFFGTYNIDTCLNLKATNLCNIYVDNMLGAQQRLAQHIGKRTYPTQVHKELPGAPVGRHCVYGQYVQLQRALDELGDTLTIVPGDASRSCSEFKKQMRKRYPADQGYDGCLFEGKMFQSDSAYIAAQNAYLARHHVKTDAENIRLIKKFEQKNFSVESIEPGAMLIVPRTRGSKRNFHMIVYVGRGHIKNGNFIPDAKGRPVFTAHNRERIGYLFDTWDTNNVFVANTHQIARTGYARELGRVESLPRPQLIEYLLSGKGSANTEKINKMPLKLLQKMARDKYFQYQIPHIKSDNMQILTHSNAVAPFNILLQQNITHTM